MMDLDKHNLVYQSNSLVNANYDMTALEQKLLLINISTISKKDTNSIFTHFQPPQHLQSQPYHLHSNQ